jgi:hypothetical protein
MRFCREFIALALAPAMISAQNGSQHSVEMRDIDRDVAPCTKFYDYANGTARSECYSGVDGSLEPPVAGGRTQ